MFIIVYSYADCVKKIAYSVASCSKVAMTWVAEKGVIHISESPNIETVSNFGCEGSREEMEEKRAETNPPGAFLK